MLKKRYILIILGITAVLLGSLFYNNLVLAQRKKPPTDVNVVNFPLDEQGNIRVTQMNGSQPEPSWKVINIVEDLNVTWDTELSNWWVYSDRIDLGSVSINGYSQMVFYAKLTDYTDVGGSTPPNTNEANLQVFYYLQFEYGEVWKGGAVPYFNWETGSGNQPLFHYTGGTLKTYSPSIRIEVMGGSLTPSDTGRPSTISCLVSIGIYLRNE